MAVASVVDPVSVVDPPEAELHSKFVYVAVSVQRARQLRNGARPRVEPAGHKLLKVAMLEVSAGAVSWEIGQPPGQDGDTGS